MRIWDINPADQTVIDPAGRECPIDPMTGEPKVPGNALAEAPPATGEHEAACAVGNAWEVVADWRGHVYWTADRQRHEVAELGVTPPADALDEAPPEPAEIRRDRQLIRIDTAAGQARLRYVSAGQLIEEEYRQAKFAVAEWRAAGSPADAVPPEIVSGAEYSDITHEAAAVEIEQTATAWEGVLSAIRDLRLNGKRAVKAAPDAEIESVAQGYIEQLDAMAPAEEAIT